MEMEHLKFVSGYRILILIIICGISQTDAFSCYKCISNENPQCVELDPVELPPSVSLVQCEGFCTIVRTEFTDIPGEVVSLVRDCDPEQPLVLNDVRTDKHYTKMYTSCDTDRCNLGDGKREPGENGGPSRGPSSIIIIAEGSTGTYHGSDYFSLTLTIFTFVWKMM